MPESDFLPSTPPTGILRVENLAKKVINDLGKKSPADSRALIIETSVWLANVTTTNGTYEQDDVLSALFKRGVSRDLIVDYCLPEAARLLGDGWMTNLRSFGQVNLGTARIQALLHKISLSWENLHKISVEGGLFLITCQGEDHTLGPRILSDQLRRKGYSVNLLIGAEEQEVVSECKNNNFNGIIFSCSGLQAFDNVVNVIKNLKRKVSNLPPVVLGGNIIDVLEGNIHDMIQVDLITKDLEEALRFLKSNKKSENNIERTS